ncbi:hypothetical protein SDC9_205289 [bioreactor metagenome]|uniref:Uncharacterized protein n=1 Tax=bioreactor metagenome TaxID=1076179 RepID=A0A645J1N8_9ZZZZ
MTMFESFCITSTNLELFYDSPICRIVERKCHFPDISHIVYRARVFSKDEEIFIVNKICTTILKPCGWLDAISKINDEWIIVITRRINDRILASFLQNANIRVIKGG